MLKPGLHRSFFGLNYSTRLKALPLQKKEEKRNTLACISELAPKVYLKESTQRADSFVNNTLPLHGQPSGSRTITVTTSAKSFASIIHDLKFAVGNRALILFLEENMLWSQNESFFLVLLS